MASDLRHKKEAEYTASKKIYAKCFLSSSAILLSSSLALDSFSPVIARYNLSLGSVPEGLNTALELPSSIYLITFDFGSFISSLAPVLKHLYTCNLTWSIVSEAVHYLIHLIHTALAFKLK